MKIGKRPFALLLALALIAGTAPPASAADGIYSDVPSGHWAGGVISKWSGNGYGVLQGDGRGRFFPESEISLAELSAVLSRTFGYTERTPAEVAPGWADEYVEKAVAAGIIAKAGIIDAAAPVTREQAIRYIAIAYGIAPIEGATAFADDDAIGAEYRPYVNAFQKLGHVTGKPGNIFDPAAPYTRAEAMQVIENTTSEITDKSVSGQNYAKSLIIRKSGVTVTDTTVKGDLIVGQGVGDGDVTLDNVAVEGKLLAYGGGPNSIIIKGGSKIALAVLNKRGGEPVRLKIEGDSTVAKCEVKENSRAIVTGNVLTLLVETAAEVVLPEDFKGKVEIDGDGVKIYDASGKNVTAEYASAPEAVKQPAASTGGGGGPYIPVSPSDPTPPDDQPPATDGSAVTVYSAEDFMAALDEGGITSITVGADMMLTERIRISGSRTIIIPADITVSIDSDNNRNIFQQGSALIVNGTLKLSGTTVLEFYTGTTLTVTGTFTGQSEGEGAGNVRTGLFIYWGANISGVTGIEKVSNSAPYYYDYRWGGDNGGWYILSTTVTTESELRAALNEPYIQRINIYGQIILTQDMTFPSIQPNEKNGYQQLTVYIVESLTVQSNVTLYVGGLMVVSGTLIVDGSIKVPDKSIRTFIISPSGVLSGSNLETNGLDPQGADPDFSIQEYLWDSQTQKWFANGYNVFTAEGFKSVAAKTLSNAEHTPVIRICSDIVIPAESNITLGNCFITVEMEHIPANENTNSYLRAVVFEVNGIAVQEGATVRMDAARGVTTSASEFQSISYHAILKGAIFPQVGGFTVLSCLWRETEWHIWAAAVETDTALAYAMNNLEKIPVGNEVIVKSVETDNLTIPEDMTVSVVDTLTITGSLTVNGKLNGINGAKLTLGAAATISGSGFDQMQAGKTYVFQGLYDTGAWVEQQS